MIGRLWKPCQVSAPGMKIRPALRLIGRRGDQIQVVVENVGAPGFAAGIVGEIDQHREQLGADVGVRLEPEAVGVEAIFDAQIGARAGRRRRSSRAVSTTSLALAARRRAPSQTGYFARASTPKKKREELCVSRLPERVGDLRRLDGQRVELLARLLRQHVRRQPVAIGLRAENAAIEAGDQAGRDRLGLNHERLLISGRRLQQRGGLFDARGQAVAEQFARGRRNRWSSS